MHASGAGGFQIKHGSASQTRTSAHAALHTKPPCFLAALMAAVFRLVPLNAVARRGAEAAALGWAARREWHAAASTGVEALMVTAAMVLARWLCLGVQQSRCYSTTLSEVGLLQHQVGEVGAKRYIHFIM